MKKQYSIGFMRAYSLYFVVGLMHILYSGETEITEQILRVDTMPLNYVPIFKMEC